MTSPLVIISVASIVGLALFRAARQGQLWIKPTWERSLKLAGSEGLPEVAMDSESVWAVTRGQYHTSYALIFLLTDSDKYAIALAEPQTRCIIPDEVPDRGLEWSEVCGLMGHWGARRIPDGNYASMIVSRNFADIPHD